MVSMSHGMLSQLCLKTGSLALSPTQCSSTESCTLGQDLQRVSGTDAQTLPLLFLLLVAQPFLQAAPDTPALQAHTELAF